MIVRRLALVGALVLVTSCSQTSTAPVQSPKESPSPESIDAAPEIATVKIPDVRGEKAGAARQALQAEGMQSSIEQKYSGAPTGSVIGQQPAAGKKVDEGTLVTLVVAKSLPKVPSVVGRNLASARNKLINRGFEVRTRKQTSTQPENSVISQKPKGGSEARPGKIVTLVLAKAPPGGGDAGSGGNCTPGYSPCLSQASDWDCAGGSGDGPKYVNGTVNVSGSDPYGLDADNDGVGCE